MEQHKLLTQQLMRLGLTEEVPNAEKWTAFKDIISRTYVENDQERYLLERSMELSSQEMGEINRKLQEAQEIAGLGYWMYDRANNIITLSRNLYEIYGLDPTQPAPKIEDFMKMVHEEDRLPLKQLIDQAFQKHIPYEREFRMRNAHKGYKWYFVIGRAVQGQGPVTTLTGVVMDITKRKKAEEELRALHQQLVESSRYAGMADIASFTLHNVGNVLNSATVSLELLKEQLSAPIRTQIRDTHTLLQKNLTRFPEYIQNDPQGKFVPEYLVALLNIVKNNYDLWSEEIGSISRHLSHIKDIISTQNDMSRKSGGLTEKVFLPQLIDTAVDMASTSFDQYNIRILKEYQEVGFILVDKVKLLQILVNLIRNAKDALLENVENIDKTITCSISEEKNKNEIIVSIEDNGSGIDPKNIDKIFSLGFTTKPDGHGFGLHMSAVSAGEIGGNLAVESKGPGKGAVFKLILPKIDAQTFQ